MAVLLGHSLHITDLKDTGTRIKWAGQDSANVYKHLTFQYT